MSWDLDQIDLGILACLALVPEYPTLDLLTDVLSPLIREHLGEPSQSSQRSRLFRALCHAESLQSLYCRCTRNRRSS